MRIVEERDDVDCLAKFTVGRPLCFPVAERVDNDLFGKRVLNLILEAARAGTEKQTTMPSEQRRETTAYLSSNFIVLYGGVLPPLGREVKSGLIDNRGV